MNGINEWTPRYHFYSLEPEQMPFDPNGAIFWKGRYHLFYLYQEPPVQAYNQWGHVSSADLVHWKFHKPALLIDHPGEVAMNSGNALIMLDGRAALVYSSIEQGICIAVSDDDELENWKKIPENPVIPYIDWNSPEASVTVSADPYCWIENGHYFLIVGSRCRPYGEYDTAYLYRSDDMLHWEYLRPLYQATDHFSIRQDDCSCPEFFDFGKQKMLLHITHARGSRCYLGDWIMDTFVPRCSHFFNFPSGNVFACRSMLDGKGRRLAWFWMDDRLRKREDPSRPPMRQTWSLPRVFEPLPEGNGLRQFVPEEIAALSGQPVSTVSKIPAGENLVYDFRSRSCRIHVSLILKQGHAVLHLFSNAAASESLQLIFDKDSGKLVLDHSTAKYKLPENIYFWVPGEEDKRPLRQEIPWPADEGGRYEFDIYLDNCIAELFDSAGRYAAGQCVYTSVENDRIILSCSEDAVLEKADLAFHEMKPLVFER